MIVNFLLTLENAIEDITHLCTHRVTNDALHSITSEVTVCSNRLWQFGYFVSVGTNVCGDIVTEVSNIVAISEIKFKTVVLHLSGIYPH